MICQMATLKREYHCVGHPSREWMWRSMGFGLSIKPGYAKPDLVFMLNQSLSSSDVDEIVEGRPWWKNCFVFGVIGLFALAIIGYLGVRFFFTGGPVLVNEIPESFPSYFALYEPEEIDEIYYFSSKDKQKSFSLALVPLKIFSGLGSESESLPNNIMDGVSVLQGNDTVSLYWSALNANRDDVLRFYAGVMMGVGISDPQMRQSDNGEVSEIIGSSTSLNARLVIVDSADTDVIENVTLILDYPVQQ